MGERSSVAPAVKAMNSYFRAEYEFEDSFEHQLVATIGEDAWKREETAGSTMTLDPASRLRSRFPARQRVTVAQ